MLKPAEIVVDVSKVRVVGAVSFFEGSERAVIGSLAILKMTRILIEHAHLIEHRSDFNSIGAEGVFGERERFVQRGRGLFVTACVAQGRALFAQRAHAPPVRTVVRLLHDRTRTGRDSQRRSLV